MRIVAGKYRHRLIEFPNVESTRPTTDKVREALMSAIGYDILNKDVLDLFSGSGAMGIESLSRGARSCVFVDNNKFAINIIKSNLKKIGVSESYEVIQSDYLEYLKNNKNKKFSLVILDPPYKEKGIYSNVLSLLKENDMISEDAIIVMESDIHFEEDNFFSKMRKYKYGTIHVTIYWR